MDTSATELFSDFQAVVLIAIYVWCIVARWRAARVNPAIRWAYLISLPFCVAFIGGYVALLTQGESTTRSLILRSLNGPWTVLVGILPALAAAGPRGWKDGDDSETQAKRLNEKADSYKDGS